MAEDAESYFIFTEDGEEPSATPDGSLFQVSLITDVYIAPDGDDRAEGTVEAPLRTLHEAVNRAVQYSTADAVTIWLRGGTYMMESPLYLAGNIGKRITFSAYPGETPVLTGARRVEWLETAYFDGGRIWTATVDAPSVRALYSDSGTMQVARWPKSGMLEVAGGEKRDPDKFEQQMGFYASANEVPPSLEGAVIRILHWWKDELSGVRGYDAVTGHITLNRPTSMAIEKGDLYWFENVLGTSLSPGEWSFDATMRTLSYMPQEGETIEGTALYAGIAEQLIQISGVSGVTFEGIHFVRTGWEIPGHDIEPDFPQAAYDAGAAVRISESKEIRFDRCTFREIGAGAIRFESIVQDVAVVNCTFSNIGAQAVYVHGQNVDSEFYITQRITIENNEIRGYGRNFYNAAAVLIIHAREVNIAYNEIHDGTYTAISAGWVWGTGYNVTDAVHIRNNLIYNIGQGLLSDMGAIYLLGTQPNTVISGNIIHNVHSYDYGGWGIYLDEGTSGIMVTQNLVYRCSAQGFHQHIGKDNTVINNIFALNADGQVGISGKGSFLLERNIVVGEKPHLNVKNTTGTIRSRDNLFRTTPSLFVDADSDNFNLVDGTAMEEIGFEPWVFHAGRRAP